ncbi:CDP-alcohol phosphatidyltransferase family protein [Arthrobacter terrae]|uniref:CDP-alcohol phosphatidyltransferase family protein n=1 Tax=Arthrobacter terrae TaxID=2935737 RepID=UPI001E552BF8|nr:CDP-alcohol phosphatidyltransferase family protein [Arthrobacter terrae]
MLAAGAYRAGLTSNAVTGISALFTFSGILLLVLFPPSALLGIIIGVLLVLGYAFDSADGQVARLRGGGSPAGEWLDHMADAVKISALPLFMVVGFYRFDAVPRPWLLVPLAATIIGAGLFFGMILTEQLRRQLGTATPVAVKDTGGPSWVRSVLVIPMDYGVLCLSFFLLGVLPVFVVVYTFITAATAGFFLLAAGKWFRELKSAGAAQTVSLSGGAL